MSNPFRSLNHLPWTTLLLSAGLTVLVATALDILLQFAMASVPVLANFFLLGSLFGQWFFRIVAAFGIGTLSVVLTSNFFPQIMLRADTLWALVGCVLLALLIKSQFRMIPTLFVTGPDYFTLMATVVGTFTQGRRYWRY
ncbi:MAG: hypothetical protein AAFO06_23495 [Cyanobacteria bacterium J06597_16]